MVVPHEITLPRPVRLGPGDAGEMLTLQRAAYVTEAQAHDDPRLPPLLQTLEELRAELAEPVVIALGLRENGRLIGSVRLRPTAEGRICLGRLAVVPDRQGHGFGTMLLRAAESAVLGAVAIDLFTGEHSPANLRLYAREGYVETHRTRARSYDLIHLSKDLR